MPVALGTIASQRTATAGGTIPTSGLLAWYSATDLALSNGAGVTSWADLSGAGRTLTAAGATPTFQTGIQNGQPGVWFPNTDTMLKAATSATFQHFVVVADWNTGGYGGAYPGLVTGTGGANDNVVMIGDGGTGNTFYNPGVTWTYHRNGVADATLAVALNSTPWVMSLSSSTAWPSALTLQLGGDRTNGGRWWYGHLFEIIGYNRVLNTAERQQVEAYLKTKWGTP